MNRLSLARLATAAIAGLLTTGLLAAPASAAGQGTVRGVFTTAAGDPIAGAAVTAYEAEFGDQLLDTTTDADGRYELTNVPAGEINLSFSADGWRQYSPGQANLSTATDYQLADGATLTVDERQSPHGALVGRLTDASGAPQSSVFVTTTDGARAYTDEDGNYQIKVAPGRHRVAFHLPAMTQWAHQATSEETATVFEVASGATVRVDEALLPTGSLGGRITASSGEPLAWAQVGVHRDGDHVATAYTDDYGRYRFDALLPGEYQVSIEWNSAKQYVPGATEPAQAQRFTVTAGAHTTVNDTLLPPGALRGKLTEPDGNPQEFFTVAVTSAWNEWEKLETSTDQNGGWQIDGLAAGDYVVSFTNPAGTRTQWAYGEGARSDATVINVRAGVTGTVDDTWQPGTTLAVKGVDAATGAPVTDFCVRLPQYRDDAVCSGAGDTATVTELPPGATTFDVETSTTGYHLPKSKVPADLVASRTTAVTVPLELGGKIALRATDRVTAQPVAETCFLLAVLARPAGASGGCTDAAGRHTSQTIPAGTYELFAKAPGVYGHQWVGASGGTGDQKAAARIVVTPGKTTRAPAALLDRAGKITGVVTGADGTPLEHVGVDHQAIRDFGSGEGLRTHTDSAGRYSIDKLGPYAWPLLFSKSGYPQQWSGNVGNRFQAVKIPVTAGGARVFNMKLAKGSALRGSITLPSGADDWVRVLAYNAATGDLIGHWQGEGRSYEMPLIGDQQVKLQWDSFTAGSPWHAGARDIGAATPVGVSATRTKTVNLIFG